MVLVEPLAPSRDARGFLIEPLEGSALAAQQNVHAAWTVPGSVRGNHYHALGTEVTLVLGPALVRYRDEAGIHNVRVKSGDLCRFTFPPRVEHAYGAPGPESMFLVGFNTEAFNARMPDAVSVRLLDPAELGAIL